VRLVADTNVVVSGLLWLGNPHRVPNHTPALRAPLKPNGVELNLAFNLNSSVDDGILRQVTDQKDLPLSRTGTKMQLWRSCRNGPPSRANTGFGSFSTEVK
jgi:hypothetical protein